MCGIVSWLASSTTMYVRNFKFFPLLIHWITSCSNPICNNYLFSYLSDNVHSFFFLTITSYVSAKDNDIKWIDNFIKEKKKREKSWIFMSRSHAKRLLQNFSKLYVRELHHSFVAYPWPICDGNACDHRWLLCLYNRKWMACTLHHMHMDVRSSYYCVWEIKIFFLK